MSSRLPKSAYDNRSRVASARMAQTKSAYTPSELARCNVRVGVAGSTGHTLHSTGTTDVVFKDQEYNVGGIFDMNTSTVVIPRTGLYDVGVGLYMFKSGALTAGMTWFVASYADNVLVNMILQGCDTSVTQPGPGTPGWLASTSGVVWITKGARLSFKLTHTDAGNLYIHEGSRMSVFERAQ